MATFDLKRNCLLLETFPELTVHIPYFLWFVLYIYWLMKYLNALGKCCTAQDYRKWDF